MRIPATLLFFSLLFVSTEGAWSQESATEKSPKSVAAALGIVAAGTLVPMALVMGTGESDPVSEALAVGAMMAGPLPGLAYAGDLKRGLKGVGARVVIIGLGAAFATVFQYSLAEDPSQYGFLEFDEGTAFIWVAVGAGFVVSYVADLLAIPPAVRRYNEDLSVSPVVELDGRFGARIQIRW